MRLRTISLFPELFESWLSAGLIGQAYKNKLFSYENINPRQFAQGVHQAVDDKVYGGGDGMAQSFLPWSKAIEHVRAMDPETQIIFLTPQGELWRQGSVKKWSKDFSSLTFVCGRYAGFDERLIYRYADFEISIGDYILNGGELPAQVLMESLIRAIPNVLGHEASFEEDSFGRSGGLECPSFTRPQEVDGLAVPQFLLSGHHDRIETLKKAIGILRTVRRRPDLIEKMNIDESDVKEAELMIQSLSAEEKKILGVSR